MNTIEKLNALDELHAHLTLVNIDYEEKRKQILSAVQDQLDDLELELAPMKIELSEKIGGLEFAIKADVLNGGITVKGNSFMCVWSKGRVSWDTKALDGYAAGHPEIAQFRKEGDPSVSIRKVG